MFAPALLLFQMVSYSNDIAPVLAFHCNRCHGDEGIAAEVDTRTYRSLKETTNLELMMDLLEGRRGASRRMPKEAPALDNATLEKFRRWIAADAPFDRESAAPQVVRRELARRPVFRFAVEAAGQAYVSIEILDRSGRLLHREAGVVRASRHWTVRFASHWPMQLAVVMTARYADGPATLRLLP